MENSEKQEQRKNKFKDIKIFNVPFKLGEIKEYITITTNTPSQSTREQLIDQAINYHLEGNISEARKYYQKLINQGCKDQRVFSNYGVILKDLGELEKAEVSTRKAIELNPKYANAHYNLGLILKALDKLKDAELSTRKAIELNTEFTEAHSNLGLILKALGNLQEAELSTRKAIELNPNFAEAHYNLGIILKDHGELQKAELSTRKAIQINPSLADAHYNLGSILRDLGNLQEAEVSTRKAIQLNPDYAEAHLNLGNILQDLGQLKDAEVSTRKAIELDPKNQSIKNNLINLLTVYEPKIISSNPLYVINKKFRNLILRKQDNYVITDREAIQLYKDGLKIYRKYNLNLETSLTQAYKRNEINLNCKRHMLIFKQKKIIPEFCFGCYKVQVEVNSIIELIKLFLVFNTLELTNYNTRKCMIELRPNISGFYKGLIYCLGLNEALEISKKLNTQIQSNIRIDLISKVKRGCSEYPLEFPQYKEIKTYGDQPMNYNENWSRIEKEFDQGNKNWGKSSKSIEGFNLNNFLIMRNWIAYAQKIGDQSVNKITDEQIKGPRSFNYLNKEFQST